MAKRARVFSLRNRLGGSRLAVIACLVIAIAIAGAGCGDDTDGPVRLAVDPTSLTLAKGRTGTATATVNGAASGRAVTWKSANPAVATVVEADDGSAVITAVAPGETTVSVSLREGNASVTVTVGEPAIDAIAITPPTPSLAAGTEVQLTATATLSDATTRNVTAQVTWNSSDKAKATIDATGRLRGLVKGTTTVTAALGALSAAATATISDATLTSIAVTPVGLVLAKGLTRQMVATGTFSDATTQDLTSGVTWASSADAIASVSASGVVTGLASGSAMISAALGAVRGQTVVEVTAAVLQSIAVTPVDPSLAKGLTLSLTATGTFSDATTADLSDTVLWASSDPAVATSNGRLITAVAPGDATITATSGAIVGSTALTVTPAVLVSIEVTPAAASLAKARTQQLTATGIFSDMTNQNLTAQVIWSSSNSALVAVSNADGSRGLVTAVEIGSATVSATLGAVTGTSEITVTAAEVVSIAVTPATFSLPLGRSQQLTAVATYGDNTTLDVTAQATWASSADAVASVSNAANSTGLVSALSIGTATITATVSGVSGSADATVTAAVLDSIAVVPATSLLTVGLDRQYLATGTFSDASTQNLTAQVTWSSSDAVIAEISNAVGSQGLASGRAPGTVTITATLTGVTATAALEVVPVVLTSIAVTPATSSVPVGRTQALTATGTFSNNATQDLTTQVTWSSSNATSAAVSNVDGSRGQVTALAVGAATISATLDGIVGSATVNVVPAVIVSIAVTPASSNLDVGGTQAYVATATLSDTTTQNVTTTAIWDAVDKTIATVSNEAGTQGVVTGVGAGTTSITATQGGIAGSASVSVRALVSIAITPVGDLARGTSRQLVATGTYSDNTTAIVTETATWSSSNSTVVTVSNVAGRRGLALAVTSAGATAFASIGGVIGSVDLAGCYVLINEFQVQGPGGDSDDWVEIASTCSADQNLAGLLLVYRSNNGAAQDILLSSMTGVLPANGYRFYTNAAVASRYDGEAGTFTQPFSNSGGGLAVRAGPGGGLSDSVGYGFSNAVFTEGNAVTAPSAAQSAARRPNRGDTNANSIDFSLVTTRSPGAANP